MLASSTAGGRQIERRFHDADDASDLAGAAPDKVAGHTLRDEAGIVRSPLGPFLRLFEAEKLRDLDLEPPWAARALIPNDAEGAAESEAA